MKPTLLFSFALLLTAPSWVRAETFDLEPGDELIAVVKGSQHIFGKLRWPLKMDAAGNASVFPTGETVRLLGRTQQQIAADLVKVLAKSEEDHAAEIILHHLGRKMDQILVAGQVAKPGLLPCDRAWTLEEAIEAAGGRLPSAGPRVMIVRGDGQQFGRFHTTDEWEDTQLFSRDRIIVLLPF